MVGLMIRKTEPDGRNQVKVTFSLPADGPRVSVVGDFNAWDPDVTVLRRRGRNQSAAVVLDPGRRYAFRYRAETGAWFDDPAPDAWEDNGFGGANGIIDLGQP